MNPFDYVKNIQHTKENLMADPQSEKEYQPFLINKTLSYEMDCLMQANEMNQRHHLDKKLQYHYLINIIRARKRPFHKWIKPETSEVIDAIKLFFDCSDQKAQEALRILSTEEIELIQQKTIKGGIVK
jgi:hypothetical protein